VLEDFHWADQPSLLLLEFVTRELADWQNREFRITAITRQHLTGVESALQY